MVYFYSNTRNVTPPYRTCGLYPQLQSYSTCLHAMSKYFQWLTPTKPRQYKPGVWMINQDPSPTIVHYKMTYKSSYKFAFWVHYYLALVFKLFPSCKNLLMSERGYCTGTLLYRTLFAHVFEPGSGHLQCSKDTCSEVNLRIGTIIKVLRQVQVLVL